MQNVQQTELLVVATLLQLIVIVAAARLAGNLARLLGQPRAVGEIIAGLLLGPSLLGHFWPDLSAAIFDPIAATPMLVLSQIGLIFLMFQLGCDFDFRHLRHSHNSRAVGYVAAASIIVPTLAGTVLGWFIAPVLAPEIDRLAFSLFIGVALCITALPTMGRILREYGLTRDEIGVVAISAAAINDVTGWVLLAGVAAYAASSFSPTHTALQVGGLVALMLVLFFLGRPIADWLLKRWPIKDGEISANLLAIVLAGIFLAGIATERLGVFTIFGGFLLGLLFHRHEEFAQAWRRQIGQFVLVFFLPIFFTYTGLRTNILGLTTLTDWAWCLLIVAVAVLAKIVPVTLAARAAGVNPANASTLGVLMNTRALMELIVLNLGLSLGIIPPKVFTMLVVMAVCTTVMTAPLLRMSLKKAGKPVERLTEA
ncbi:potassium transporter Kef [Devosia sp. D6-9]|nr:potassium transporter Kef [Devosia sp. D6-9]